MTDMEVICAMLDRAGIVYEKGERRPRPDELAHFANQSQVFEVTVRANAQGERNIGYSGFYSIFGFEGDGSLLTIGAWE